MIDPPDRILERYIQGTDTVEPGEGWGEWGEERAGVTDIAHGSPRVYRQFFRVLSANQKVTLTVEVIPDYWVVKVSAVANNSALVYPYEDAFNDPLLIDSGAMAVIPGVSQYFTIVAGANGATVSVQCQIGHDKVWQGT